MYDNQQGLCALCQGVLDDMRSSCVEHCHTTGKIRGLVHNKCNIFIGIVEDQPLLLTHIKNYLT